MPIATPLLTTKLYIPRKRANLVLRPRLIERLNEALQRRLTLISAPAGFGKTTLLVEWFTHTHQTNDRYTITWLSLDRDDNDPTHFWTYFISALQSFRSDIGASALTLLGTPASTAEAIVTLLLNDVTSLMDDATYTTERKWVLVLDDYHVIENESLHQALTFLVEHLPPNMRLVITSRANPPMPLSRFRVRGQLAEIRANDLRFSQEEVVTFLNHMMQLDLSEADIAALESRTEGWAAGLQLAALSMQGKNDHARFIAAFTGSNRYIMDYLVEEVLRKQPAEVEHFLLNTCVLNRLSASLCDMLVGRNDSQSMLVQLERANLFVLAIDYDRQWYRYHPLFAEVLRSRLQQIQPERISQLHRQASRWYAKHDLFDEAVAHALAAADHGWAAALIERSGKTLLGHGAIVTLRNWLQALPVEVVQTRPRLSLLHAWALFIAGDWDAIEACLNDAESALRDRTTPASPNEIRHMAGETAALRGSLAARLADSKQAIELCRIALDELPQDDLRVRSEVLMNLGEAYSQIGELDLANDALRQAASVARAGGHIYPALYALYYLAFNHMWSGKLDASLAVCQQALKIGVQIGGQHLPALGMPHVLLGQLYCEWNDLPTAEQHAGEAITRCQQLDHPEVLADSHIALARVLRAQGDHASALEHNLEAQQIVRTRNLHIYLIAEATHNLVTAWLAHGDMRAALRWAHESGLSADDELDPQRLQEYAALARVLIADNRAREALPLLARVAHRFEALHWAGLAANVIVLQALAHWADGDQAQAGAALMRCLEFGRPQGYIRLFVDEGEAMQAILTMIRPKLSDAQLSEYVDALLAAFPTSQAHALKTGVGSIDALTEREFEVLQLVAQGLSDREVAERLVVVVGTVKRHLNSIYSKLGVHSRTQALARAREEHLI